MSANHDRNGCLSARGAGFVAVASLVMGLTACLPIPDRPLPDVEDVPDSQTHDMTGAFDVHIDTPDEGLHDPGTPPCVTEGDCDDDNPCTSDTCDLMDGCLHAFVEGPCLLQPPDCMGDCQEGQCVDRKEELNGLNDDCALDDAVDEDFDLDHDGVCSDPETCLVNEVDSCPTVWNPDNDPSLCPDPDPEAEMSVDLFLMVPDAAGPGSPHRRTNEPVEIPLRNGFVDDSVEGHWKLDHGMAWDHSGKRRHGVIFGTPDPTQALFGLPDGALDCQGGYVEVPDSLDSLNPPSLTVTTWFRSYSQPAGPVGIVEKWGEGGSPDRSWRIGLEPGTGEVRFSVSGNGVDEAFVAAAGDLDSGEWTHVAGTFEPGRMAIYVDGRLASTSAPDAAPAQVFDSSGITRMRIGHAFPGAIDEVLVFSRVLSPAEIGAYALSGRPYGSLLVPGSQPDFDDLRVTEVAAQHPEYEVPVEVIGVRPHSDSACGSPDGTKADREDLCGVVAYWRLDGGGQDASGNGHHLTAAASKTFGPGRFGDPDGALVLDSGDKVQLTTEEKIDLHLPTFTLESWVHCPSSGWSSILGKSGASDTAINYQLFISQNGFPACRFHREGATGAPVECVADSLTLPLGRWTHLACTYDQDHIRVYVDGMEAASCEEGAEPANGGTTVFLGGPPDRCRFDEVLIHDAAKSPGYLLRRIHEGLPVVRFLAQTDAFPGGAGSYGFLDYALHWGTKTGTQEKEAHLPILEHPDKTRCYGLLTPCLGYEGWWKFDEGTGTVVRDSAAGGYHGTLAATGNAPWWTTGSEGSGLWFDGFKGHVDIPTTIFAETATVEAWVSYGDDFPNDLGTILESWETSSTKGSGFSIAYVPYAGLRFNVGGKEVDQDPTESPIEVKIPSMDPTDLPVALTHDEQEKMTAWVGYEMVTEHEFEKEEDRTPYAGDQTIHVGRDAGTEANEFHSGAIDSVRIMNRVLTSDEFLHHPLTVSGMTVCTSNDGTTDPDCDGAVGPDDCAPLDYRVQEPPTQGETCGVDYDCDGLQIDGGEGCEDGNDVDWDGCYDCQNGEYPATALTQGDQSTIEQNRSLVVLPDGRFVVAWSGPDLSGEPNTVSITTHDPATGSMDAAMPLAEGSVGGQVNATVLTTGHVVAAWAQDDGGPASWDIVGQQFNLYGAPAKSNVVNTYTAGQQLQPVTTAMTNGRVLVTWASQGEDGTDWDVFARPQPFVLFPPGVFAVNPTTEGDQFLPVVAHLYGDIWGENVVIAWISRSADGNTSLLLGQRFYLSLGANAQLEGSEFSISETDGTLQDHPAAAAFTEGSFVVAWEARDDPQSASAILIRRFTMNGTPLGGNIPVSADDGGDHVRPSVSTGKDDSFVVAWERDSDGDSDVLAQRFDADGQPVGTVTPVNLFTTGFQGAPSVAIYDDGHFRVVWTSQDQDGDGLGVFTQRFDPFGNKVYR